jgi:hypothetical protein
MTPEAAKDLGVPREAPLAVRLGQRPGDAAGTTQGSYRSLKGGRRSVPRPLLPGGARRAGRWAGGGCGWSWESSRWSASLWERGPCS